MDILYAFADLQLRGQDKYGEIYLKANPGLDAHIGWHQLNQIIGFPGGRIGCQVIPVIDPAQHIDPEVVDAIRQELDLRGKTQQKGLYLLGCQRLLATGGELDMIRDAIGGENKLGEGKPEFQVIG